MQDNWPSTRRFITKQLVYRNPYFPRESAPDRRKRHRKLWTFLGLIIFGAVVYFLIFSSLFRIKNIQVAGGTDDRISSIRSLTNDYLDHKTLGIFPRDNWLIISTSNLKSSLEREIVKKISLEYLKVTKRFPRSLIIDFKERTAQLIVQSNSRSYLVDNQGVVVSEQFLTEEVKTQDQNNVNATEQTKSPYPIIRHGKKETISIGQQIFPSALAQAILEVNQMFTDRFEDLLIDHFETIYRECVKIEPAKPTNTNKNANSNANTNENANTEINENTNASIDDSEDEECVDQPITEFSLVTPDGLIIYFSSTLSVVEQINSLSMSLNDKLKNMVKDLKYIDLRYIPRVYYK
ncbi:MAG: hypothetical protein PHH01_03865 [Patescibacteria group bacterium]|nr:hypothetical protein [Patescibacteria group bacterium]